MASTEDKFAGELLRALREERRLTPEQVPHAMVRAGIERRAIPCSRTVRRAETGITPRLRVQFAFADFYGRERHQIWAAASAPIRREPVLA